MTLEEVIETALRNSMSLTHNTVANHAWTVAEALRREGYRVVKLDEVYMQPADKRAGAMPSYYLLDEL